MSAAETLRMTEQRRVILEELRKVKTHPTADEVYRMVRRRLPRISLGTVYRNLELLSEHGIIQRPHIAGKQKRFDGNTQEHYHFRCRRCGSVRDLPGRPPRQIHKALNVVVGDFKVTGCRLELFGLCPACRRRGRRGSSGPRGGGASGRSG